MADVETISVYNDQVEKYAKLVSSEKPGAILLGFIDTLKKTYNINARCATFDDLTDKNKYDGVWANFSLLHAPIKDFPQYLKAIHASLRPEGVFHIGMKLGNGMHRDSIGRMYSYYSEEELTQHLSNTGFKILDKTFGEEPGLSGEIASWITVLCKR